MAITASMAPQLLGRVNALLRKNQEEFRRLGRIGSDALGRLDQSIGNVGSVFSAMGVPSDLVSTVKNVGDLAAKITGLGPRANISTERMAALKKQILETVAARNIKAEHVEHVDHGPLTGAGNSIVKQKGDIESVQETVRLIGLAIDDIVARGSSLGSSLSSSLSSSLGSSLSSVMDSVMDSVMGGLVTKFSPNMPLGDSGKGKSHGRERSKSRNRGGFLGAVQGIDLGPLLSKGLRSVWDSLGPLFDKGLEGPGLNAGGVTSVFVVNMPDGGFGKDRNNSSKEGSQRNDTERPRRESRERAPGPGKGSSSSWRDSITRGRNAHKPKSKGFKSGWQDLFSLPEKGAGFAVKHQGSSNAQGSTGSTGLQGFKSGWDKYSPFLKKGFRFASKHLGKKFKGLDRVFSAVDTATSLIGSTGGKAGSGDPGLAGSGATPVFVVNMPGSGFEGGDKDGRDSKGQKENREYFPDRDPKKDPKKNPSKGRQQSPKKTPRLTPKKTPKRGLVTLWKKGLNAVRNTAKSAVNGVKSVGVKGVDLAKKGLKFAGGKGSDLLKKGSKFIGGKGLGSNSKGIQTLLKGVQAGGKGLSKAANLLKTGGKVLGPLANVGLAVAGAATTFMDPKATKGDKGEAAGGAAGSLLGAAIGQALIPIPVLGAMVGSFVGEWIGKKAGRAIAEGGTSDAGPKGPDYISERYGTKPMEEAIYSKYSYGAQAEQPEVQSPYGSGEIVVSLDAKVDENTKLSVKNVESRIPGYDANTGRSMGYRGAMP
ncbi:hypothetical protein P0082_07745 [Candidatus Haliotispira prima]|uniref:Tail tape measure protein n=1 Tax=Candidatus Haliotispira prima TaxID=3034016 RepID=A0ABY8MEN2_9SPIO|nr:hypothetical protein P0082_07745 [Candidatus Haliotispira prima]